MRKITSLLLSLLLLFSLAACGGPDGTEATDPPAGTSASSGPDAADPTAEPENTSEPTPVTPQDAAIEETVLVDESGVKITAKSLSSGIFGTELALLIENSSDTDLTVQARNSSVNGYMVETMMSVDVAAGKKANDTLTFQSSSLEACGIETIADMEFSFHIFTTDGWDTYLDTDLIQLKTSAADSYQYAYDDSGTPLYEGDGVTIVSKGLSEGDSIFGTSLMLYIYNSSEQGITVQARDVSVNGFMVEDIFSEELAPGKRAIASLTLMSSDLEENDITTITDMELSFHIFTTDGWDTIRDTDVITLTF